MKILFDRYLPKVITPLETSLTSQAVRYLLMEAEHLVPGAPQLLHDPLAYLLFADLAQIKVISS